MMARSASLCLSLVLAVPLVAQAQDANRPVTFSKDVAPIFQRACQTCHHAGTSAPMSLVTYQEARPCPGGDTIDRPFGKSAPRSC